MKNLKRGFAGDPVKYDEIIATMRQFMSGRSVRDDPILSLFDAYMTLYLVVSCRDADAVAAVVSLYMLVVWGAGFRFMDCQADSLFLLSVN